MNASDKLLLRPMSQKWRQHAFLTMILIEWYWSSNACKSHAAGPYRDSDHDGSEEDEPHWPDTDDGFCWPDTDDGF